jgi:hypothetical protein
VRTGVLAEQNAAKLANEAFTANSSSDKPGNSCKGAGEGKSAMETPYDWITILIFAGLIVLFLQRSQGVARDHLWQYLVAAVGCAVTNYLGNEAMKNGELLWHLGAVGLGLATLAFIWFQLRPFSEP